MADNLIEQIIPPSEAAGRADNVKGVVLNYSALPLVGNNIDDVYFTLEGQGIWGINRKPSDYYIWTGSDWRGTYNKLTSVTGLTFSGAEQVLSASTGAIIQTALDTKVARPISSVNDNIATVNGVTGKLIKDSGIPIGNTTPVTLNADTPTQNGLALAGQVLQAKLVTATTHGLMDFADKVKLNGISAGATANQTDAYLLARANHTGTQLANTISNFQTTVSANTDVAANTAARHAAVTLNADAKTQAALALVGQELQIKKDVYDKANETGIEQITGGIITPPILTATANNYAPTGFATANMIRQDIDANNREISGFVAPAVGVNRIIRICNISTVNDLRFLHNDAGSIAANRLLIRDDADKSIKPEECATFWYDHISLRWRPLTRVG